VSSPDFFVPKFLVYRFDYPPWLRTPLDGIGFVPLPGFGHVWSLSHLDCHDFLRVNGSVLFRATLNLLPTRVVTGAILARRRQLLPARVVTGAIFGPTIDFNSGVSPPFFWVVGLPWFIPAPPSPHELRGWLGFYRCGVGLVPCGAVAVGVLMWLGCPGDPIGRRGGVDFFCWVTGPVCRGHARNVGWHLAGVVFGGG